jgi:hypothetical protein
MVCILNTGIEASQWEPAFPWVQKGADHSESVRRTDDRLYLNETSLRQRACVNSGTTSDLLAPIHAVAHQLSTWLL